MKTVTRLSLCATAAMLGATMLGGTAMQFSAAYADEKSDAIARKAAEKAAKQARRTLSSNAAAAAAAAEQAVALVPGDAGYRALLGQSYLSAGRFVSAAQALTDALALDPSNGRAALNLALAQVAQGDWQTARTTLDTHAAHIAPADRGLAIALAGDPMGAVTLLGQASREPGADAKVRQNLALSLALAGLWAEAKTIAEIDLSPGDVHKRLLQWATFTRPTNAWDQVASLLGVVPVADAGQPVRLALNAPAEAMAAVAQPVVPIEAYLPPAPPITPAASVSVEVPMAPRPAVMFAERREIVQAIPAHWQQPARRASMEVPARAVRAAPMMVAAVTDRSLARGAYHVQLGAFENAGVARDAWGRLSQRVGQLRGRTPYGARVEAGGRALYRLSVGGFARGDADALCRSVRAKGGECFVRQQAGDAMANWARGPQLAMR